MYNLCRAKKLIFYLLLIVIIMSVGFYGFFIEPYDLEVHQLRLSHGVFRNVLKDVTVVHLSDLHIRKIGAREKEVLKVVDDIKPDMIFLTGDYVNWDGDYEPALDFLSRLKARYGVWAVMGDYDYSNSRNSCLFCHEKGTGYPTKKHGVRFLRNSSEIISFNEGYIHVYGIDNTGSEEDKKIEIKNPAIILSHSPMEFELVDDNRDILMLSGDTHGGQIPLPSWLWRFIGYEKNALYNHGLYKAGHKTMYLSRGIGTSHIPFRFFRRPEVVVIRF
jgi:uncharacterized protein